MKADSKPPATDALSQVWEDALLTYQKDTGNPLSPELYKQTADNNNQNASHKPIDVLFDETEAKHKEHRERREKAREHLKTCVAPLRDIATVAKGVIGLTPYAPAAIVFDVGMYLISKRETDKQTMTIDIAN